MTNYLYTVTYITVNGHKTRSTYNEPGVLREVRRCARRNRMARIEIEREDLSELVDSGDTPEGARNGS